MTAITVYGGAGEIGGNKILVEDRDTRVWFDFGEPFGMKDEFFVNYLMPRDRFGLRDYFHFDLLPRIKGLYDRDWLAGTEMKHVPPEFDAIFLSHMHFDHVMHLKYADSAIPAYLGAAADKIRKSWEATGSRTEFGDHKFRTFRTGQRVKIGSLEVVPVHVDHSTPGAYGFVIHTSSGCIAYSGDMRLHGPRSDMTEEFVRLAAKERPVAMLCEGTRVSDDDPREGLSEKDVQQRAERLISRSSKLAIVSFYPKDVDRMRTFRDVARATRRKFVVSAKVAHLLDALKDDKRIVVPDPLRDPNMLVYVRKLRDPRRVPYELSYIEKRAKSDHIVDSDYVRQHQRDLIFHTDFNLLTELIDIKPAPGSLFIRSKSEPFEEDDAEEEVLQNWIDSFRLDFQQAHASGHASMGEIFSIVERVAPKVVIPVHTEHPELFERCSCPAICPEQGRKIANV
jgi:ribonuclease J